jgi:guanine nucleotide-binding protein subunit alpha
MRLIVQILEDSGAAIPNGLGPELQKVKSANALTPVVANSISEIWHNKQMIEFIQRIDDSNFEGGYSGCEYFFENSKRFAESNYKPTKTDILSARVKTTGVTETRFTVLRTNFTVIDVGGQRSERKKWLNHFQSVSSVIFLTAINEYDMDLSEDSKTNRLEESLVLWKALSSSQYFQKTPFILFLNKSDLFKTKINQVPLSDVFSDYDDFVTNANYAKEVSDFDKGCHYIRSQFQKYFGGYIFYFHITNARDTEVCQKVFNNVQHTILDEVMKSIGS